jgi:transmembrane sensor
MIFRRTPETATEWIVRLNAGPLSWWDRWALNRWVAASPKHLEELEAAQALNEIAQSLAGSPVARQSLAQALAAYPAPLARHGFALPSLTAAAVAAMIMVMVAPWNVPSIPRLADQSQARTGIGEITDYILPDRSQVTVAGDSTVSVAFTDSQREISLEKGEAFFDVQPDDRRPFVITAGARKVTVTGTSFNVNYLAALDEMEVAVVEGAVNVAFPSLSGGGDETETMRAGDVILFPSTGRPLIRRNLTAQQVSAWRSRKLYFDAANLGQVLSEVNRYSTKPLISETRDIDRLMLSGQFQAGDVESLLISLQQLYGIEAREANGQWVLARKPGPATSPR